MSTYDQKQHSWKERFTIQWDEEYVPAVLFVAITLAALAWGFITYLVPTWETLARYNDVWIAIPLTWKKMLWIIALATPVAALVVAFWQNLGLRAWWIFCCTCVAVGFAIGMRDYTYFVPGYGWAKVLIGILVFTTALSTLANILRNRIIMHVWAYSLLAVGLFHYALGEMGSGMLRFQLQHAGVFYALETLAAILFGFFYCYWNVFIQKAFHVTVERPRGIPPKQPTAQPRKKLHGAAITDIRKNPQIQHAPKRIVKKRKRISGRVRLVRRRKRRTHFRRYRQWSYGRWEYLFFDMMEMIARGTARQRRQVALEPYNPEHNRRSRKGTWVDVDEFLRMVEAGEIEAAPQWEEELVIMYHTDHEEDGFEYQYFDPDKEDLDGLEEREIWMDSHQYHLNRGYKTVGIEVDAEDVEGFVSGEEPENIGIAIAATEMFPEVDGDAESLEAFTNIAPFSTNIGEPDEIESSEEDDDDTEGFSIGYSYEAVEEVAEQAPARVSSGGYTGGKVRSFVNRVRDTLSNAEDTPHSYDDYLDGYGSRTSQTYDYGFDSDYQEEATVEEESGGGGYDFGFGSGDNESSDGGDVEEVFESTFGTDDGDSGDDWLAPDFSDDGPGDTEEESYEEE